VNILAVKKNKHSTAALATRKESPSEKRKEILVPIDFSSASVSALRHTRKLAAGEKAHVILLNVVEERGSFRTLDVVGRQRVRCAQRAGRLQELANRELGPEIAADIEVREGKPSVEIARLAGRRHVDLIVVGLHRHHGLWEWAHGHTASKLLKKARCPVLMLNEDRSQLKPV